MSTLHLSASFSTRTSCESPDRERVLESQFEELWARARANGVEPPPERIFIDEGYSSAERLRPALEQLRDLAATGALDRLYVPCPDRLARNCAHRNLLIDELHGAGVEVVFLNHDEDGFYLPRRARS
jgi:site-specific DNA recombinase